MIEYFTALPWHCRPIANRMGAWDRIEVEASGLTPIDALRLSVSSSTHAWTAMVDGKPVAIWGVTPVSAIDGIGTIWLLGSDDARQYPRAFYEGGRRTMPIMLHHFPRLENHVACGNKRAIKLLTLLGFTVGGEIIMRAGVEFVPFWIDR